MPDVMRLSPMRLPPFKSISEETVNRLNVAEQNLINGSRYIGNSIQIFLERFSLQDNLPPSWYKELSHDLSFAWSQRAPRLPGRRPLRYPIEHAAYMKLADTRAIPRPHRYDGLQQLLASASVLIGEDGVYRRRVVGTSRDLMGGRVIYPPADTIPSQLAALSQFITGEDRSSALFLATVSMAAVMNDHPFSDGNGRVARILFNLILNQRLGTDIYLPLYEIFSISEGGFIIRLRDALYNDNWDALLIYMCFIVSDFWRLVQDLE